MSLRIKHLNADSSWLLIFSPPCAGPNPDGKFPGSFTILIDPWLSGPSKFFSSRFALVNHKTPSCVASLRDLPTPDLVICSQDKSDHCHEETLRQLWPDADTLLVGTPAAAKKMRSFRHFDSSNVRSLKRFDPKQEDSLFRITIPPFSPNGSTGEVTIALLAKPVDLAGLHNAIGITYRAPSSIFSGTSAPTSFIDLPMTPPESPPTSPGNSSLQSTISLGSPPRPRTPISTTIYPAPYGNREKTLSVLYSPHGCGYDLVKAYATTHLLAEAALPLTAFLHSWTVATNPWYFGGNVCGGYPTGVEIAHSLFAKVWISSHDEEKDTKGISTKNTKFQKFDRDTIKNNLDQLAAEKGKSKTGSKTAVLELDSGQEYFVTAK